MFDIYTGCDSVTVQTPQFVLVKNDNGVINNYRVEELGIFPEFAYNSDIIEGRIILHGTECELPKATAYMNAVINERDELKRINNQLLEVIHNKILTVMNMDAVDYFYCAWVTDGKDDKISYTKLPKQCINLPLFQMFRLNDYLDSTIWEVKSTELNKGMNMWTILTEKLDYNYISLKLSMFADQTFSFVEVPYQNCLNHLLKIWKICYNNYLYF